MKKFILATLLLMAAFIVSNAKPHTFGQQLSGGQCQPSTDKRLVLNIVFQVTGDADSGVGGYWASDSYTKHVQVWDMADGTFCARVKYNGSFVTVAGKSPSGLGTVATGVTGTMDGGYTATFTGTFAPGARRTKGNIGSKEYGCVITDGVADQCKYFSWLSEYFTGGGDFNQPFWGWTYNAGDNGTWVNASTENSGDITGTP